MINREQDDEVDLSTQPSICKHTASKPDTQLYTDIHSEAYKG